MTTLIPPFINFRQKPTRDVTNTPTLVFGSQYTALLDSLVISNQTESPMIVSVYMSREEKKGKETNFSLFNNIRLEPSGFIDLLINVNGLTLEAGDLVYAYSDYSNNFFSIFISYRELIETGE